MANTKIPLFTRTLTSTTSTIDIDVSSYTDYSDLEIVCDFAPVNAVSFVGLQFNGVTLGYNSSIRLYGYGTSPATSDNTSNSTSMVLGSVGTSRSLQIFHLQDFRNTTTFKSAVSRDTLLNFRVGSCVGTWRGSTNNSTEAITSIRMIAPDCSGFTSGSTINIYGIKSEGFSGTKALGGVVYADSTHFYHVFASSATFTPTQSISADVLVVGGGGGGGCDNGGGGGAGGVRSTTQSLTATNYTVTVGAGGNGSASATALASNGEASTFNSFSSSGGGGGSSLQRNPNVGSSGGSGGGGAGTLLVTNGGGAGGAGNSGSYTPVEGFAGGSSSFQLGAPGGGGAGAVGSTQPSSGSGGAGGIGTALFSSWGLVTGTGQNVSGVVYYGGGGGGGANAASGGSGGLGGGSKGADFGTQGSVGGTPNTGGGGGGGGGSDSAGSGSRGGSGIVIIRYLRA